MLLRLNLNYNKWKKCQSFIPHFSRYFAARRSEGRSSRLYEKSRLCLSMLSTLSVEESRTACLFKAAPCGFPHRLQKATFKPSTTPKPGSLLPEP